MNKLLHSGFRRLWRSVAFWISLACICLVSFLFILSNYGLKSDAYYELASSVTAAETLFPNGQLIILVLAIFMAVFVGREHGDKVINNKIIMGHSRMKIYFSNLIVCGAAALIIYLIPMVVFGACLGGILIGNFAFPPGAFVLPLICNLMAMLGFVSLYLLIIMLVANRVGAALTTFILALMMLLVPMLLSDALTAPKYIYPLGYFSESGAYIEPEILEENPAYLDGTPRQICQFFYDFLPSGQLREITFDNPPDKMKLFPVYSFFFIAATIAGGSIFFRYKELR